MDILQRKFMKKRPFYKSIYTVEYHYLWYLHSINVNDKCKWFIMNIKLANTESILPEEIQNQVPMSLLSQHLINTSIPNHAECVFLFKVTLFNIYWFISTEFIANNIITQSEQSLFNTHITSKAYHITKM